jgi:hypothetical protein
MVTRDGGGNWVAVWSSDEANVDGGIGTDWDILYSTDGIVVGGSAGFPDIEEPAPGTADSSGGSPFPYAALAGGLAVGVLALAAGGWYAAKLWVR